ncbi:MFS transporter, DHA2 family, lincomycin resistance protein [Devosia sp. YR412]|uniref:DHA2 family efflux MFS transporter permease subunit n=1 Tax=Devosia sp. YR412 TaxID=1881030 RepID=UPI0008B5ED2E|nr:DHA2 family efflux MFS transporter permease subunit [Devosia sp. YR412]SEP83843.1 MFS transporter, DHA2 family, lincomycin resistance protein [Devosia sp. YR412]
MSTDAVTFDAMPVDTPLVEDHSARNRLVIALLLVSAFVVILNETIMGVAVPHLMGDLGVTAGAAQWLTTGFLLTMAVVIPITGYLLQRLNTRPVFMLAMSFFTLGTLICAAAPGIELLIVGRVVQAVGTAIMMPLLMTTVMNLVPPESRGKTMGNISIVISVAPAIGPTISGLILSVLEWRWMFILVLPIALGALALGATLIKNVSVPSKAPLDLLSVLLSIIGFGGFVYGLSGLGEGALHAADAAPPLFPSWLPIVVGVVFIAIFVFRQLALQRDNKALLDLRTLTSKNFSISVVMMAVLMIAMFGSMIMLPIYLQSVIGLSTLQTGLLMLPGGLVMGLCAPFVGSLFDKIGPTPLLVPGAIMLSAVMWAAALVQVDTPIWALLAGHLVLSIGLALMFTPLFTASLGSLKPHLYSHGSAMIGTTQQVAGAAGTALFVALMTLQTASLVAGGTEPVAALAGGIRSAFFVGAIISLFAVAAAFFIRKPEGGAPGMGHGH